MTRRTPDWLLIVFWALAIPACIGFWLFCVWATAAFYRWLT